MSIFSKIFYKSKEISGDDLTFGLAVDKIFSYLTDAINRKELASECFELIETAKSLSGEDREDKLVKAYFCLEDFIAENKPLVVKKETDKTSLRKEIARLVRIEDLPVKFKIPFSEYRNQLFLIFLLATRDLVKYLKGNIGEDNFVVFLNSATSGGILSGKVSFKNDTLIFEKIRPEDSDDREIEYSLKKLFGSIAGQVASDFGRATSETLIKSSFDSFSAVYPAEFIKFFLNISPLDFLVGERTALLEKNELQRKIVEASEEQRIRSEEAEELSRKLQLAVSELSSNKAAILNLLEDLGAEKGVVEKEVEKRTQELKSEQSVLRATIDSLPVAYFLISADFFLLENNKLLNNMFSSEKIGSFSDMEQRLAGFFPLKEHRADVLDKMTPQVFNNVSFGNKFFKIYLQPVASVEEEEKIGLLGLVEDTTEQKILERSKDEFFSIASHELRTPLTAIMGNTSMILDFFESQLPNKEVKQMVEDIHEASTRLLKIVGDFLDVSRLEQGKIIFNFTKLELSKIIQDLVRDFESAAILKGVVLRFEEMTKDTFVYADEGKVKQIVSNLISNAINYTTKGEISVYIKKDNPDSLPLYIKDTGVGISEENKILLFRKFQQAQEKLLTRDASRSTGLGLYISRLLASAMGGSVDLVESSPGKGSTFRLVLPIKM